MKVCGGVEILLIYSRLALNASDQLHAPVITPWEGANGIHCRGDWARHRVGLNVEERSWSWSSYCCRQSVDQFVLVSGLPLGPLTRFDLVLIFSADNYLIILSKASSLTRKRVCSLQWNHSLVPITILYSVSSETVFPFCRLLRLAGTTVKVF
jgi:hypothetical protein